MVNRNELGWSVVTRLMRFRVEEAFATREVLLLPPYPPIPPPAPDTAGASLGECSPLHRTLEDSNMRIHHCETPTRLLGPQSRALARDAHSALGTPSTRRSPLPSSFQRVGRDLSRIGLGWVGYRDQTFRARERCSLGSCG